MPSHISRGKSRAALGISALATVLLALSQPACERLRKVEGASPRVAGEEAAQAGQASLFTVSADQQAHLKVVPVTRTRWSTTIHTTGTVDWDADHTTQAITQVNGPISRILVDLGSKVKEGDPLLYVASPDVANAISTYRKARNREALAKRMLDRNKELLTRGALAGKGPGEQRGGLQRRQHRCREQPAGAADLRHHPAGDRACGAAGRRHQPGTGGARADRRRGGAEAGIAWTADSGRRHGLLRDQRRLDRLGAGPHLRPRSARRCAAAIRWSETNPAFAGTFRGEVAYVGALVDPATRTTPVRIVTHNPEGLLKKDMFVDAAIRTGERANLAGGAGVGGAARRAERADGLRGRRAGQVRASAWSRWASSGRTRWRSAGGLQPGEQVVSDGSLFVQFAMSAQ